MKNNNDEFKGFCKGVGAAFVAFAGIFLAAAKL